MEVAGFVREREGEAGVSVDCAGCDRYACRAGRVDAAPVGCPMRGEFPDFEALYGAPAVQRLAYHAARVEGEGYCRWTRIHEIGEVARRMDFRRVGVAYCPDTAREATLTARYLGTQGLEVTLGGGSDCDPVGQAARFRTVGTELNVIAGMCVGHDALFMRHSRAPVTSLVVRDRRLRHNPVAALYTRTGYLRSALYRSSRPAAEEIVGDWDDDRLDRLARQVRDGGRQRSEPPCRLEEVMEFAHRAGVRHLGVVFCTGFREEARYLKAVLGTNGFRVSSVCCKTGAVPKERLGLEDGDKVRPGRAEMMCNPLAQAELLERERVDLVLLLGQCVGHDSATIARLETPAICLVAKDRVLAHNTVAALYELDDTREVQP